MFKWFTDIFGNGEPTDEEVIAEAKPKFKTNCLLTPGDLQEFPQLCAWFHAKPFHAPVTVDLRDYCTQTENQGDKPWCAAYAAAGMAENITWRRDDFITEIDPGPIYADAKKIDGDPNGEGTSLTAVLKVLLNRGIFDPNVCKIQVINGNRSTAMEEVKYAIHKFGVMLGGLNITEEWYLCGPNKTSITGKSNRRSLGGHAILICGYNKDGVIIHNSWGEAWGSYGFALITWDEFIREFIYGATLSNCLNNMKMN